MLIHLSQYGLVKTSGIDAKKLLQGQLTCDVEKIKDAESTMGALCNPQGRVISLFHLFKLNDAYYLLLPKKMIPPTLATLKKYAVFYKVELSDASHQFVLSGCDETRSRSINSFLVQVLWSKSRRVLISDSREEIATNEAAWKMANIIEGIPEIYPETSGRFLPHEINLHQLGAISFEKGCYTGQEIIARMHYRGKLKNHLYLIQLKNETALLPGSFIYNQKKEACGTIVDACLDTNNDYHALVMTDETNAQMFNLNSNA